MKLAAITFPSETYWIADARYSFVGFHGVYADWPQGFNRIRFTKPCAGLITGGPGRISLPPNHPDPDACVRHLAGNIIVFADGHAKWVRWNQMEQRKAIPTRTEP
jgi:prepilin-type processing-associated H-X9-DG protein